MAQISTNIVYSINRFKIPSDEIEIGEVFNPIASNFNGWTQYEENAKAYVEDGLLKFPSIEDDDINYSIIYNENIPNIIKIEFDWKVECTEDDSALGFSTSEIFDFMTGSVDWEHKIFEFKSASYPTFVFFKMEENSSGDGTGYFKNIVITTSNKIFEIKNGNYIRSKVSRFPTILNQSNFKVSRFPTTLNHNNFKVSRFPTTLNHNNFKVSKFKNLGIFEQGKEILEPIKNNLKNWGQYNEDYSAYTENDILKHGNEDFSSCGITKFVENVTRVEFDYKTNIDNGGDSCLSFSYDSNSFDCFESSDDWENKVFEFESISVDLIFFFMRDNSDDDDNSEYGYFKNIKIYTDNDIIVFVNGNYIKNQISRFPTTLNHNTFKVSKFPTTLNHNTFIIKSFTNQTNHLFYRLGRDLTVPPKRIIFKNFED